MFSTGLSVKFNYSSMTQTFWHLSVSSSDMLEKRSMGILSDCLMSNHWHRFSWPEKDGNLGRLMHRLTVTHVTRWQKNENMVGQGRVYQSHRNFLKTIDAALKPLFL
jgi:REP element-mobilizing transposase RayT